MFEVKVECKYNQVAENVISFIEMKNINPESVCITKTRYYENAKPLDEDEVIFVEFDMKDNPDELIDSLIDMFGNDVGFMTSRPKDLIQ